jgi:L-lactate dehydrogenase complex protein LldG
VSTEGTVDTFLRNAAKASAGTSLVQRMEDLSAAVSSVLGDCDAVYCPGLTDLEKSVEISPEVRVDRVLAAKASVEEVHGAIAETGSIICTSADGRLLQVGLLPDRHVAIVARDNIYANLDDFFASCEVPPTNITLITGPSRTADIELSLTIGVHGPEALDVIVV